MNHAISRASRVFFLQVLSSLVLAGCRGGDDTDISDPQFPVINDPDAFGLFLNPSPAVPKGGAATGEIDNIPGLPETYCSTIDPDKTHNTFNKWREANGFINPDGTEAACDPSTCRQTHVKSRDTKALDYGRNMFLCWNTVTRDVADYVEKFLRKPSNGSTDPVNRTSTVVQGYHEGGYVLNEDAEYSRILSWILNGAPSGAIPAANTIAAGTPSCTTN